MADPRPGEDPSRPLHRSGSAARAPILVVLVGALILGGLIDRAPGAAAPAASLPGGGFTWTAARPSAIGQFPKSRARKLRRIERRRG